MTSFKDQFAWLNRSQIIRDICDGEAAHADEMIRNAALKNLSSHELTIDCFLVFIFEFGLVEIVNIMRSV